MTDHIASAVEISFPITAIPRLTSETEARPKNIEVSPARSHWPELDEAPSFEELLDGGLSKERSARQRISFFRGLAQHDPEQRIFLNGCLNGRAALMRATQHDCRT